MHRAHPEARSIESLAEQERNDWFVRDMLVDATLRHTQHDRTTALKLLTSAMAQLASGGEVPSRVSS